MNPIDHYRAYAEAFEETFLDDNWLRLAPFFHESVAYRIAEGETLVGREAALGYLERSVNQLDRRFEVREFVGEPVLSTAGSEVTMQFTVRYRKAGLPALLISGRETASFSGNRIVRMNDEFDDATDCAVTAWLQQHGPALE